MTTKPKARKFRIRRTAPLTMATGPTGPARGAVPDDAATIGPGAVPGSTVPLRADAPRATVAGILRGARLRPGPAANTVAHHATTPDTAPDATTDTAPDTAFDAGPASARDAQPTGGMRFTAAEQDIDAIRREGLTGRQLRLARRVAQKNGIAVTSDFDAVRQLRMRGIDPFQRSHILELVRPQGADRQATPPDATETAVAALGRIQLPQTVPLGVPNLPSTERAEATEQRMSQVMEIQRDILRRRRRKTMMLFARLAAFVLLPTFLCGWYFFMLATPMYATQSEFIIQQADSAAAGGGLGGLFQGTSMATQQDSITVQSYLASRAALLRLDQDHAFKAHFSDPAIDPIQRLPEGATNEQAYGLYQDHVKISYDPTEGIVKMEVIAADPATSQRFSEALIGYAEEQVDQLTQRLREDQMAGARNSYLAAEDRRAAALAEWLQIQQDVQQIDPIGETSARTAQISALETARQQLQLELQTRLSVARPNAAQVNSLRSQIANIEQLIGDLRAEMTQATANGASLASKNTELRLAEENYTFQTVLVQQALQMMEASQIEANRQVRYLSLGVEPLAPDEATYPRAFENTALSFLIFAGIYLMISLTVSILREQVTS